MRILFGKAQVTVGPKGKWGPVFDTVGPRAYADLKGLLGTDPLKTMINQADDQVEINFKPDSYGLKAQEDRQLKVETSLKGLWNVHLPGAQTIKLPLAHLPNSENALTNQLWDNLKQLSQIQPLENRLDAQSKRLQIHDFGLSAFAVEEYGGSDSYLRPSGLRAAELLANLFEDTDIQKAFRQQQEYQQHTFKVEVKKNDFYVHLRSKGVDPRSATSTPEYQAAAQGFEPQTPKVFELKFNCRNLNFEFPPTHATGLGGAWFAEEFQIPKKPQEIEQEFEDGEKYKTVQFTLQELEENPAAVKRRILEAKTFWNRKIAEYVG